MTFQEVIKKLRDGKAYKFTCPGVKGYFYKAPFPERDIQTKIDRACSAITYYEGGKKASPTLMLYDFDSTEWTCKATSRHPLLRSLK